MSDSKWSYLGLTHNPFSDPQSELFPGADRDAMLSKMRQIGEWSRPILTISGPHGVGKTCLFRALSASLEAGVVAARVNGSLVSRAGDVLSALVQGYGVAAPADADAPLLIELIVAHLNDQADNNRTSLVLVDDAHLLEQRAVDDLVNLVDVGARLAFFAEPQFVESLQRAVERNAETGGGEEVLWQEMLLSPFSREQSGEYLEWRFAEAGYDGRMPFTEYQVDLVHRTSQGYPGRLDFAANEQLMLMTVGGARTAGMPRKHLWLAGSLACVLGLTLWLWSPEDGEQELATETLEMPEKNSLAENTTVDAEVEAGTNSGSDNPIRERAVEQSSVVQQEATVAEPAERVVARTIAPVPVEDRSETEDVVSTSRTVRPDPPTRVATPEPRRVQEVARSDSARTASWLLAQSDASYTIQLIGFGEAERAKSYLSEQDRPERFALFRTRSGERVVHVVTYGLYDSLPAAEAAAQRLPGSIGKVTPWIRRVAGVKSAIRTAVQSDG